MKQLLLYFSAGASSEVPIDAIPAALHKDIKLFLYGATVRKNKKGQYCFNFNDYKAWLRKIWLTGFDYNVNIHDIT